MSEDIKIGVQLTPKEIQLLHRAVQYYISDWGIPYAEVEMKLLRDLEDAFKRIVVMEAK